MKLRTYVINHLVKSEDLNHHGTLFAGKTAMWFVESGFIAAASLTNPENTVCLNIHGMLFMKPIHNAMPVVLEGVDLQKLWLLEGGMGLLRESECSLTGERLSDRIETVYPDQPVL